MDIDFDDMFPSRFFKASDLDGPTKLKIAAIKQEKIADEHKYVVNFHGHDKMLVLNKTNGKVLMKMYGKNTRGWLGKPITLVAATVDFKGDLVDAVRVKFEQPQVVQSEQKDELDSGPVHAI
jgi:hypothetical protein